MKGTDEYRSEEDYEDIFADRIVQLNDYIQGKDWEFDCDFAYGGVRLVKKYKKTGAELDLSCRFFYDEDGTADYDAFMELLNAVRNTLRETNKE